MCQGVRIHKANKSHSNTQTDRLIISNGFITFAAIIQANLQIRRKNIFFPGINHFSGCNQRESPKETTIDHTGIPNNKAKQQQKNKSRIK